MPNEWLATFYQTTTTLPNCVSSCFVLVLVYGISNTRFNNNGLVYREKDVIVSVQVLPRREARGWPLNDRDAKPILKIHLYHSRYHHAAPRPLSR